MPNESFKRYTLCPLIETPQETTTIHSNNTIYFCIQKNCTENAVIRSCDEREIASGLANVCVCHTTHHLRSNCCSDETAGSATALQP